MQKQWVAPIFLALGACAQWGGADEPVNLESDAPCPVIDSRGWRAWVDLRPGADAEPTLHVVGEVDLPTPGYRASWRLSFADRAMPPGQHIELLLTPPDGAVPQVVTTELVGYQGAAQFPDYRAIIVDCGDATLTTITDVETVR